MAFCSVCCKSCDWLFHLAPKNKQTKRFRSNFASSIILTYSHSHIRYLGSFDANFTHNSLIKHKRIGLKRDAEAKAMAQQAQDYGCYIPALSQRQPEDMHLSQQDSLIQPKSIVHRTPFYYGWVIMAIGTFGMIMSSPGQTYSVSVFIEHFIADLGLSRSVVSTLYTIGTLTGSLALPLVGRHFDQAGARRTTLLIIIVFGCATLYMGFVHNALMLSLGFVAIRMFGQGSLSLVSANIINNWWAQHRGKVLGIAGLLTSLLGLGTFPSLINWLIPVFGWRITWAILGGGLLIILLPLSGALIRNKPEEFGLRPDGLSAKHETAPEEPVHYQEEHWTLKQARRTPVFWISALGRATIAMLGTGLTFHNVSVFLDNGLTVDQAASVFISLATTTALVNFTSGIIVDRFPVRYLLAIALLFQGLALWMALNLANGTAALFYGTMIGIYHGLFRTVSNVLWPIYFGREHLGSISGVGMAIMIAGSALGPMPFGIARDLFGNYNAAFQLSSIVPFVLAVLTPFILPPRTAIDFPTTSETVA